MVKEACTCPRRPRTSTLRMPAPAEDSTSNVCSHMSVSRRAFAPDDTCMHTSNEGAQGRLRTSNTSLVPHTTINMNITALRRIETGSNEPSSDVVLCLLFEMILEIIGKNRTAHGVNVHQRPQLRPMLLRPQNIHVGDCRASTEYLVARNRIGNS